MPPDRQLLLLATAAFLAAVVPAVRALVSSHWRPNRQWLPMLIGFLVQTGAVYLRGQAVGQCPMKSLSDVLVFISWSVVLLYFLIGPAYRVSLLGVFTAPVVTAMHVLAFVLPNAFPDYAQKAKIDPYVELHAALALIAFAAFALGCISGVMYLLQERLLKRHRISGLFYQLPSIHIINKLKESKLIVVEGTLYPLLNRLKDASLLEYKWKESKSGPPRKYYQITSEGDEFLSGLIQTWNELNHAVNQSQNNSKNQ